MVGDFWLAVKPFFLLGGLANSDFFALERKARLASERSAEACAGLERKSKKIGRRKGGRFHATFSISATAECIDKSAAPARSSAVASAPSSLCPRIRRKPSCALSNATPIHLATWSVLSFHRETLPTTNRALRITFSMLFVLKNVTFNVDGTFKR